MKSRPRSRRCPACGRRTTRRIRHIPVVDERCSICVVRGYWPPRTGEKAA